MNIKGVITVIENEVQVSESFKKRVFVVEYADNPQYPELISFETIQDKTSLLDALKVGDNVSVEFNLKGRKWTNADGVDKYFNQLQAWKIESVSNSQPNGMAEPEQFPGALTTVGIEADNNNEQDTLSF